MSSLDYKDKTTTSYIRYYINGKRFRRNIGKVSKTVALQILHKFEDNLALKKMGIDAPQPISLITFIKEYMEWVRHNQAEKTYRSKNTSQKNLFIFLQTYSNRRVISSIELQDITSSTIEKYKQFRMTQNVTNRSINIELDFLSHLFKKAKEWNYIVPTIKLVKLKEVKKSPRFFSQEEINLLMTNSSFYLKQIIVIALNTGLRVSELLNLQWSHIDFEKNIIQVANTDEFNTKNKRDRIIPINSTLLPYLLKLKTIFIEPSTDRKTPRQPHQMKYVICNQAGSKINRVAKAYMRLLKKLNINNAVIHTLRHTFASNCVMNGVDLYTVKSFLGHKDIKTTEIYAHLSNEFRQSAIEKIVQMPKPPFTVIQGHYDERKVLCN